MRKEQDDSIDPTKPALIVLYGATRRKFRPLEGEVVVLGRAPGCDIGLVSPEVAPVHCVLVKLAGGWRIRDCSGRATRVNGKAVHDEPLRNGDTIQVGTFSFEAQLPTTLAPGAGAAGPFVERLQRSRRRLVELAMGMRRRVRDIVAQQDRDQADLDRHQADLEMLERRLRQAMLDNQAKATRAEELEANLAKRAEELDSFSKHLKREADKARSDARDHVSQVEEDLMAQRVEQNKEAERLTQWQHELQSRQTELEGTAAQVDDLLCRERDTLDRDREQVAREREYLNRERAEVVQLRVEVERARDLLASQTPAPVSSRETKLEAGPGVRLESARKLLRDLAERRKPAEPTGKGSRSRQLRPPELSE